MAFEETPLFDIIYNIFFVLCMPIVGGLAASLKWQEKTDIN